jgi:hypothetical protein
MVVEVKFDQLKAQRTGQHAAMNEITSIYGER